MSKVGETLGHIFFVACCVVVAFIVAAALGLFLHALTNWFIWGWNQ